MNQLWDKFYDDGVPMRQPECKRCGKANLMWDDDNGKWVLVERNGLVHRCNLLKVTRGDFAPVVQAQPSPAPTAPAVQPARSPRR